MDFKWKLSRPGIELEFETGSIKEAIGLLEEEGTQISTVFGFTMGGAQGTPDTTTAAPEEPKPRKPRAPKVEAVAPPPLPVPSAQATTLPPNTLQPAPSAPSAVDEIPAALRRDATNNLPNLPAPPVAPTPPPVGLLGPKVVAALDNHRKGNVAADPDGKVLANWLAGAGLVIAGSSYDDACRVVLMTSDDKLKDVAAAFGVSA